MLLNHSGLPRTSLLLITARKGKSITTTMLGFLERFVDQTPPNALSTEDASSNESDNESDYNSASSEVRTSHLHIYDPHRVSL